jgi:hypothetical protein
MFQVGKQVHQLVGHRPDLPMCPMREDPERIIDTNGLLEAAQRGLEEADEAPVRR